MTSGTLAKKEIAEKIYDMKFRLSKKYSLDNPHKLYFSAIHSITFNYKFRKKLEKDLVLNLEVKSLNSA